MKRVCEDHETVTDNQARNCRIETNIERIMRNYRCKDMFIPSLSTPDVKLIMNDRHISNLIENKNQFVMNNDIKSNNNDLSTIHEKVIPRFHANKQCDRMGKERMDKSLEDKISSSENVHKLSSNLFENNKSFSSCNDLTTLMECQRVNDSKADCDKLNGLTSSAMEIFTDKVVEGNDNLEESKQIKTKNLNENFEGDEIFREKIFERDYTNHNDSWRHCLRCNKPLLYAVNNTENNSHQNISSTSIVDSKLTKGQNQENEYNEENLTEFISSHSHQVEHQDNENKIIGECFPTVKKTANLERSIDQDYLFRNPDSLSDIDQIISRLHSNIKFRSRVFQQNYGGEESPQEHLPDRHSRNVTFHLPSSSNDKIAISEVKSLNVEDDENTAFCREIIRIRRNLKSPQIIKEKNKKYSIAEKNFTAIIEDVNKYSTHKNVDDSCTTTVDNEWNLSDENQDNDNDEQLNKVVFPKETKRAMAILLRSSRENRECQRNYKGKMINEKE
ncbi:hypothetical protein PV327_009326 [Microctonus hyperodae]|uniref:Uncharacterized protein n=1 Tax=Microctonus hyperodae TaxID=165561 RepID=A0AA39KVY2_MICHY|nr:hypothetical protein PV327_009326 [Microctonus hyperodae]